MQNYIGENLITPKNGVNDVSLIKESYFDGKYFNKIDVFFENSDEIKSNYARMFSEARIVLNNPGETKLRVEKIQSGIGSGNIFYVEITYPNGKTETYNLGKIKELSKINETIKKLGIKNYSITKEELYKKDMDLFSVIGEVSKGGGLQNAALNLKSMLHAYKEGYQKIISEDFDLKKELIDVDLKEIGMESRVALVGFDSNGKASTLVENENPNYPEYAGEILNSIESTNKFVYALVNGKENIPNSWLENPPDNLNILVLLANFDDETGKIFKLLSNSKFFSLNSESNELGNLLKMILDTKILGKDNKNLEEKYNEIILLNENIAYVNDEYEDTQEKLDSFKRKMTKIEKLNESKFYTFNFDGTLNTTGIDFNTDYFAAQYKDLGDKLIKIHKKIYEFGEKKKNLVAIAMNYIYDAFEKSKTPENKDKMPNIGCTNGPEGALLGTVSDGHRVVGVIGILGSEKEKDIINKIADLTENKKIVGNDVKNAPGCGDSGASVMIASLNKVGKYERSEFFYRLISRITKISSSNYLEACSILENFYQSILFKVVTGVMYRLNNPNLEVLSEEAIKIMFEYADKCAIEYSKNELESVVNGHREKIFKGYKLNAIKPIGNEIEEKSLKLLCGRLGITDEQIIAQTNDLGGTDHIKKARVILIDKAWGRK